MLYQKFIIYKQFVTLNKFSNVVTINFWFYSFVLFLFLLFKSRFQLPREDSF